MKKPKTYSTQLLNVTYNITIQDPPLPSCIDVLKRGRWGWGEIQFILLSNECFMFLVHWDFYLMLAVISPPFFIKCSVQMFNSHQKNIVVISMWWWILRLSLDGHGGGSWKWMWCDMNVWSKCVPIVWLFVNPSFNFWNADYFMRCSLSFFSIFMLPQPLQQTNQQHEQQHLFVNHPQIQHNIIATLSSSFVHPISTMMRTGCTTARRVITIRAITAWTTCNWTGSQRTFIQNCLTARALREIKKCFAARWNVELDLFRRRKISMKRNASRTQVPRRERVFCIGNGIRPSDKCTTIGRGSKGGQLSNCVYWESLTRDSFCNVILEMKPAFTCIFSRENEGEQIFYKYIHTQRVQKMS